MRAGGDDNRCAGEQLPRQSTCVEHTSRAAILYAFAALTRTCDGACKDGKEMQDIFKCSLSYDGGAWWLRLDAQAQVTFCPWCSGRLEAPDG